jgi:hypothetical protein
MSVNDALLFGSARVECGFHSAISVVHLNGIPLSFIRYSIRAPLLISTGTGVMIENRREGGVIFSRCSALAKNSNTSASGRSIWAWERSRYVPLPRDSAAGSAFQFRTIRVRSLLLLRSE